MRLVPGTPLAVSLRFDANVPKKAVGRLGIADGLAQLEWSAEVTETGLCVSPVFYPPAPGLHAARGRHFDGLHAFLADSLPEGWGYLLMRRRLAKLGVRIEDLSPLDRLALVGDQARGALTFQPAITPSDEVKSLDLDALAAESTAILMGEEGTLEDTLAGLAGASGGARPKVHVGFDGAGLISIADAETTPGFDAWIVKFRSPADPIDIGPIESSYASMARAAGLVLSEHCLLPAKQGAGYFATRRFDRPGPGRRLHMVSLCGAIEAPSNVPSTSYDVFLRSTLAITRHADDVEQAFRRMVFNALACNRDDHTRQQSYLMSPTGEWRLAPAYDLTYSAGPGGEHYLDIEGEGRNPSTAHVAALGRRHGLSERAVRAIVDQVRSAVGDWPVFANEAGVTNASRGLIARAQDAVWSTFSASA